MSTHLSVVIPIYGSASSLPELCERLTTVLKTISEEYEIILVNDASPDDSWNTMFVLAKQDTHVKIINLSRNFGQHHAITAGLDHAKGEWVVVMDGDLQDPPEEIQKLYQHAQNGFDVVQAKRPTRKYPFLKKWIAKIFYKVFDYLAGTKSDPSIANFGIYSQKSIEAVKNMREQNRFFPFFVNWVGFKTTTLPIQHLPRKDGKSTYNFAKSWRLATAIILSHSNTPLKISIKGGLVLFFLSTIMGIMIIAKKIFWGVSMAGWTSIIVSLLFLFGLLFVDLGILGLYIGKIFDETKQRPLYIIRDKINF